MNPPKWLNQTAKCWWRRVAPTLIQDGVLNAVSAELLSAAADAYSTYRQANEQLVKQGRVITTESGTVKTNPWLTVEKQAFEQLARVMKELNIKDKLTGGIDELEDFMKDDDG